MAGRTTPAAPCRRIQCGGAVSGGRLRQRSVGGGAPPVLGTGATTTSSEASRGNRPGPRAAAPSGRPGTGTPRGRSRRQAAHRYLAAEGTNSLVSTAQGSVASSSGWNCASCPKARMLNSCRSTRPSLRREMHGQEGLECAHQNQQGTPPCPAPGDVLREPPSQHRGIVGRFPVGNLNTSRAFAPRRGAPRRGRLQSRDAVACFATSRWSPVVDGAVHVRRDRRRPACRGLGRHVRRNAGGLRIDARQACRPGPAATHAIDLRRDAEGPGRRGLCRGGPTSGLT